MSEESNHGLDYMNKLFCTFSTKESIDSSIDEIKSHYSILYDKIFVLESDSCEDLLCTYNIDTNNSASHILANTILLHRKKETNTLYTINALNILIKKLNEGILDNTYRIPWIDYKNTVMLTQGVNLRLLTTRINKIVNTLK